MQVKCPVCQTEYVCTAGKYQCQCGIKFFVDDSGNVRVEDEDLTVAPRCHQAGNAVSDDVTMPGKRDRKPDGRFAAGDLIMNRYKVLAGLGQGGMGVVYKCFDEVAGIEIALKALPPELSHNTLEMEDIKDNFQIVHRLYHPCIAAYNTLEKDQTNGNYYLIMECCEGEDLRRWLRRKRREGNVNVDDVLPIVKQIADALDYAHEQKIIHRDIKPGNIMINSAGKIKVLDFGLAAQIHTSITRVSMAYHGTSGTGPYMAPEQWRGRAQGAPADQYALAVMTYEMLAGHLPFESSDAAVLREAVLNDVPEEIPNIPKSVQEAISRAMSKIPTERFMSCADFATAIEIKQKNSVVNMIKKVSEDFWDKCLDDNAPKAISNVRGGGQNAVGSGARKVLSEKIVSSHMEPVSENKQRSIGNAAKKCNIPIWIFIAVPCALLTGWLIMPSLGEYLCEKWMEWKWYCQKQAEREYQAQLAAENTEQERLAQLAAEKAERERQAQLAAEKAERERQAQLAAEKAEQERLERLAAEKAEQELLAQLAAENAEQERLARLAAEKAERKRRIKLAAENGDAHAQFILGFNCENGVGVPQNFSDAVKWYRKAAEQGHAEAQYALGVCYGVGNGVAEDYAEAVKWYRKAAEQNNAMAQNNLANYYYNGYGVVQNYAEAVKWYRKAAEQGHAEAQNALGVCYGSGKGVPQNFSEAVKWYRKAAEQGYADAQDALGICYGKGKGVPQNFSEAVKWFRKAAEQGNADAQNNLGEFYYNGMGVLQDFSEAVKWFRKAAEQNNAMAQNALGTCYYSGTGTAKDYAQSVVWYRKAAEQGYSWAQYNLGNCYYFGTGTAKDYAQSVVWYRKAAEQNNAMAQNALGNCYYSGTGAAKDYAQSVVWYRKAADQGYAMAQYNLGNCYYNGDGVIADHPQAVAWYLHAAKQNNVDAQYKLGRCYHYGTGVAKNPKEAISWYRKAAKQGHAGAKNALMFL